MDTELMEMNNRKDTDNNQEQVSSELQKILPNMHFFTFTDVLEMVLGTRAYKRYIFKNV